LYREEVEVEESITKMFDDWLDDFPVVLEALSVHLEMMALVLGTAVEGTYETCHSHVGAGHILAMVALYSDIVSLRYW
jgi:hypothetical protein